MTSPPGLASLGWGAWVPPAPPSRSQLCPPPAESLPGSGCTRLWPSYGPNSLSLPPSVRPFFLPPAPGPAVGPGAGTWRGGWLPPSTEGHRPALGLEWPPAWGRPGCRVCRHDRGYLFSCGSWRPFPYPGLVFLELKRSALSPPRAVTSQQDFSGGGLQGQPPSGGLWAGPRPEPCGQWEPGVGGTLSEWTSPLPLQFLRRTRSPC